MIATHVAAISGNYRAGALMLQSGPGVGKSDSVEQYCTELAAVINEPVGLVTFMLATISSVDVRGFMLPTKDASGVLQSVFSTPPWFPTVGNIEVVEPDGTWHTTGTWQGPVPRVGVVALDEFGQSEDDVKKPAAELLYRGRVGTCELPDGWRVTAAQNRMSDRSGVLRELLFIVNRRCLLNIQPDVDTWVNWANKRPKHLRPHHMTISFARKNPDIVFKNEIPPGADPFCTPRTLCLMDRELRALRGPDEAARDAMPTDGVARELVNGWIGEGAGAQYFTHLRYGEELPEPEDIMRDPSKAKLPPNRDAQMVCGFMLAHHVTENNVDAFIRYINRMNTDMQVLAIRTISAQQDKAAHLTSTREFSNWLIKHKDIMVASKA